MSNTATIEVKSAEPPKEGKKKGTVKAADGTVFWVWPDKLGLLRPGNVYEIEFSEDEFRGKTYRTITKCRPRQGAATETPTPKASAGNGELQFVTRILAASISACAVAHTEDGLTQEIKMLRSVFRKTMA